MTGGQRILAPCPNTDSGCLQAHGWKDPLQVTWLQWPWEGGLSG